MRVQSLCRVVFPNLEPLQRVGTGLFLGLEALRQEQVPELPALAAAVVAGSLVVAA
jgi:hypothetical protein